MPFSDILPKLIFLAGLAQLSILTASAMVPIQLRWKEELAILPRLHRQMYWVYGGYVVLSIISFALISLFNSREIAGGSGLARGFCLYVTVFWGIRVGLQGVFDVKEHLRTWWLALGYRLLTCLFIGLTLLYAWTAIHPTN